MSNGKKRQHPEADIQKEIVKYIRENHDWVVFSVPNEATRGKGNFKATGMLSGVSDLVIVRLEEVIFMEVKSEIGRQTPDQKQFQIDIERLGFKYYLVRTLNEAIRILDGPAFVKS